MVSAKRLAQMAKKWQKMAAMGRNSLTWTARGAADECYATTSVAVKATSWFEVPLPYLGRALVGELLSMSHDEFGFSSAGRITLPCDASVMEYVLCLLGRDASEEVERALLSSVVGHCHYGGGLEASMGLSEQVCCF